MKPKTFIIDVSALFAAVSLDCRVIAEMNEHTYEVDLQEPKNNWLYPAFLGFKELEQRLFVEGKRVHTFAAIGTGAGIDAIGAFEIFNPQTIIMTDIHNNVLPIATKNFRQHTKDHPIPYHAWHGHLAEPLHRNNIVADVIYANLPNVPFVKNGASLFLEQLTSSFYDPTLGAAPDAVRRYLLAMQYAILHDARNSLVDGGSLVINLGGRVPVELVEKMFEHAGYQYEELFTMLKAQSQPDLMLPNYAQAEKEGGIEFDFYHLHEAQEIIKKLPKLEVLAKELKEILSPCCVTAIEAEKLSKQGESIGHIVQVIRGVKK